MNRHFYLALVIATLLLRSGRAEDTPAPAQTEKWIELLEKGDFDQRKDALKKLEALGDKARAALEKALKESDSPEIRDSVERLLAGLQRSKLIIEAIDTQGRPIADAEGSLTITQDNPVNVDPDEEIKPVAVKTDAKGRFVYGAVNVGGAYVNMQWQKYHPLGSQNFMTGLSLQPGETRLRYILQTGGTVSGKVLSAEGDKPLEANVTLVLDTGQDVKSIDPDQPADNFMDDASALKSNSDEKGAFSIEHVPPGRYLAFVSHAEHVSAYGGAVRVENGATAELDAVRLLSQEKACGSIQLTFVNEKGDLLKDASLQCAIHRLLVGEEAEAERARLRARLAREAMGLGREKGPQEIKTDENGIAKIPALRPGSYWLVFHAEESDATYHVDTMTVKAGPGNALLAPLKPVTTGTAAGAVTSPGGNNNDLAIHALNWAQPEDALVLSDLKRFEGWFNSGENQGATCACDAQGKYDLQKLLPGRYSLCIMKDSVLAGVINGVDISAGKTTAVPDFKLGEVSLSKGSVRGIVLLPDGRPADSASITIRHAGGSVGFNSNEDGTFDNTGMALGGQAQIFVNLPGYKSYHLNLGTPGIDLANLRIVLEKVKHGSVAVLVKDPDGRPLKGVAVDVNRGGMGPFAINPAAAGANITDKSGRIVIKGLSARKRELTARLDGYYLSKPVEVVILPDTEASVEIVLKRGFSVSGKVELPAGFDPEKVLIYLQPVTDGATEYSFWHSASVDARGRFAFSGVRPGKVRLHAQCPGLVTKRAAGNFDAEIKENPAELFATLAPAAVASFNLGPEGRGSGLVLLEPGAWNIARNIKLESLNEDVANTPLLTDSLGHARSESQISGRYDLLVSMHRDESDDTAQHNVAATLLFPGVEISAKSTAAAPAELKLTTAHDGKVEGRIALRTDSPWQTNETGIGSLSLTIAGERAMAEIDFSIPEAIDESYAVKVAGTPPPHFHLQKPGEFSVSGLPPGDYAIYADFEVMEGEGCNWISKRVSPPAGVQREVLKRFTVAKGQSVKLGTLAVELPAAVRTRMREQHAKQMAEQVEMNFNMNNGGGEDEIHEFRP